MKPKDNGLVDDNGRQQMIGQTRMQQLLNNISNKIFLESRFPFCVDCFVFCFSLYLVFKFICYFSVSVFDTTTNVGEEKLDLMFVQTVFVFH